MYFQNNVGPNATPVVPVRQPQPFGQPQQFGNRPLNQEQVRQQVLATPVLTPTGMRQQPATASPVISPVLTGTGTSQYGKGVGPVLPQASNGTHMFRNACVGLVELARHVDPEGIQSRLNTLVDSIQRGKLNSKDLYQIRELIGASAEAVGYQYIHGTQNSSNEFDALIDDLILIQKGQQINRTTERPPMQSKYATEVDPKILTAAKEFKRYCVTNKVEIRDFKEFRTFFDKMTKKRREFKGLDHKTVFTTFTAL